MNIIPNVLTNNPCYKAGRTIAVKGIMLHSVGCPQPSAGVFVRNWNKGDYDRACVHAFIDGNTGDIYQTLPWNHRGWHSGGIANNTHIGVEMCEPASIKYISGSNFIVHNETNAKEVAARTYKSAVELFAKLCEDFNLDPLGDGVIISHNEGGARGVASNHTDPEHLWSQLNIPYTMDIFREDVKKAMELRVENNNITNCKTNNGNNVLYRVQTGAFRNKQNAVNMLTKLNKAGFEGFIVTVKED